MTIQKLPSREWEPQSFVQTVQSLSGKQVGVIFFDVDLTLVSHDESGTNLFRKDARGTILALHDAGWEIRLWSAGGKDYAKQIAVLMAGVTSRISGFHDKAAFGASYEEVVEHLGLAPDIIVDDDAGEFINGIPLLHVRPFYEEQDLDKIALRNYLKS